MPRRHHRRGALRHHGEGPREDRRAGARPDVLLASRHPPHRRSDAAAPRRFVPRGDGSHEPRPGDDPRFSARDRVEAVRAGDLGRAGTWTRPAPSEHPTGAPVPGSNRSLRLSGRRVPASPAPAAGVVARRGRAPRVLRGLRGAPDLPAFAHQAHARVARRAASRRTWPFDAVHRGSVRKRRPERRRRRGRGRPAGRRDLVHRVCRGRGRGRACPRARGGHRRPVDRPVERPARQRPRWDRDRSASPGGRGPERYGVGQRRVRQRMDPMPRDLCRYQGVDRDRLLDRRQRRQEERGTWYLDRQRLDRVPGCG